MTEDLFEIALEFARSRTVARPAPATYSDIIASLYRADEGYAYPSQVTLPWPEGATPFESVFEADHRIGNGDFMVLGDKVRVGLRSGDNTLMEIELTPSGYVGLRKLLDAAKERIGASFDHLGTFSGNVPQGSWATGLEFNDKRYRVQLDAVDGKAHWAFRRIPTAIMHDIKLDLDTK